ncbi:unannotated protein [freshwater metagenome]|uniref:Unannotated protein n=1 Tax=freshwater metagenome TaxID=449393 RepID=A0A6J6ECY6_9ZZZZ
MVRRSRAISVSRSRRAAPALGKNPSKAMRVVGRPLIAAAITKAAGPGVAYTLCPAACTAATNCSPGSLIPGVPASLISDTVMLFARYSNTVAITSCSVCSLVTSKRSGRAPMCFNNEPLRRVSSQHTMGEARNTDTDRGEMSSRLPIGVATSHKPWCTVELDSLMVDMAHLDCVTHADIPAFK